MLEDEDEEEEVLLLAEEVSEEDLPEAAPEPSVVPLTETSSLTSVQVTVPVALSMVPPLSAVVGTIPPENFAVTFCIVRPGIADDRRETAVSVWEVKVKSLPLISRTSEISLLLKDWLTSQMWEEPLVRKAVVAPADFTLLQMDSEIRVPLVSIMLRV